MFSAVKPMKPVPKVPRPGWVEWAGKADNIYSQ
jgi:hypothetical protein